MRNPIAPKYPKLAPQRPDVVFNIPDRAGPAILGLLLQGHRLIRDEDEQKAASTDAPRKAA